MKTNKMASPVNDYDEMAGWPGTIPTGRLLRILSVIKKGTPRESLDPQTQNDMDGIVHAHKCNLVSSQEDPEDIPGNSPEEALLQAHEAPDWFRTVTAGWSHDTKHTIGGVIIWMQEKSEERAVFSLPRHPEWIGTNRIMPLMKNMMVFLYQSRHLPGKPGLVIAQTRWDEFERSIGKPVPPGEPEELERIIRWHGAREVMWIAR